MSKASWKLRSLPEAAEAVRRAPSLRAAAKELGVNVSTLSRAIRDGKIPAPGRQPRATRPRAAGKGGTFKAWALRTFEFSRGERELIDIAQAALDLAHDAKANASVRLAAMREFRAVLRDLKLPAEGEAHGTTEGDNVARFPRKVG